MENTKINEKLGNRVLFPLNLPEPSDDSTDDMSPQSDAKSYIRLPEACAHWAPNSIKPSPILFVISLPPADF